MELNDKNEVFNYKLHFTGKGSEYFGILIVNWLLCLVTLGFYYTWAKARKLKYMYGSTDLNGDRFSFHGTGKEMFIGFLKMLGFVLIFYLFIALIILSEQIWLFLFVYLFLFAIIPIIIHGSYRYRMSRSSWRGIRFGYRGNKKELSVNFFKWLFLTIITLGIYGFWMEIKLNKYVIDNVRVGDAKFQFDGNGAEYFLLNLKGILLTLVTFGIYSFWFNKNLFNYFYNHLSLNKDGKTIQFKGIATAGGFFELIILSYLIIIFTLGLGTAWVEVRIMNFLMNNIELQGDLILDSLQQTEENYTDAMAFDSADFFDIDLL